MKIKSTAKGATQDQQFRIIWRTFVTFLSKDTKEDDEDSVEKDASQVCGLRHFHMSMTDCHKQILSFESAG